MTFILPTTGTDPKFASKGDLEAAINAELDFKADMSIVEGITKKTDPISATTKEQVSQSEYGELAFGLEDLFGDLGFGVDTLGNTIVRNMVVAGGAKIGGDVDWDWAISDTEGNVGIGIKDSVLYLPSNSTIGDQVSSLNARNINRANALANSVMQTVQLPTAVYNTVVSYGQSLGEGFETWPSLSKTPIPGAMMVGDNVDNIASGGTYQIIGTSQFNPLVAYTHDGSTNLTGGEEAVLTPGSPLRGEPPVIGLTNGLKLAMNRRALSEDDGRNLVAISPAIGGTTIEQLSKINTQDGVDRYGLVTSGMSLVDTLAGGDSHVVSLVVWSQGEYNYADYGGSWDKASYVAAMNLLFDNIAADAISLTAQKLPPLFITYQSGASYTRDIDSFGEAGLHVGMAQLEVALSRDDTVMVGPVYPYTDKGGHLDANGSRWYGQQQDKVARKVLLDGKPWEPLRPIDITVSGSDILISFHVPVAPLVFDTPYVISAAVDYLDKGFRVTTADGSTTYGMDEVEIVADTVVRLRLSTTPASDALVWYASKATHNGNGNLRDSDRTLGNEKYEFVPERGMYAAANIPALVGMYYPLHNWSVAFCLPVNYSEFN